MKKNLKKIVSLVLVLAMTLAISVPAFAATAGEVNAISVVKSQNSSKNSIAYQQRLKELEIVKENLKGTPGFNAKINEENTIEIYTDQVDQINKQATLSGSGLVYGPWFGGYDSVYQMSPSETAKLGVVMSSAIIPFLSSYAIAVAVAESLTNTIGNTLVVTPGQWVKVDRRKSYREVKYSDGEFAYFQTRIGASVTRSDTYLGSGETIISGGMW